MKYYRKLKGFTQESLSEKIGLNPKYITNIEAQGKFPSAETIDAIAEALDLPVSDLFSEQGCPKNALLFDSEKFKEDLINRISNELREEVERCLEKL